MSWLTDLATGTGHTLTGQITYGSILQTVNDAEAKMARLYGSILGELGRRVLEPGEVEDYHAFRDALWYLQKAARRELIRQGAPSSRLPRPSRWPDLVPELVNQQSFTRIFGRGVGGAGSRTESAATLGSADLGAGSGLELLVPMPSRRAGGRRSSRRAPVLVGEVASLGNLMVRTWAVVIIGVIGAGALTYLMTRTASPDLEARARMVETQAQVALAQQAAWREYQTARTEAEAAGTDPDEVPLPPLLDETQRWHPILPPERAVGQIPGWAVGTAIAAVSVTGLVIAAKVAATGRIRAPRKPPEDDFGDFYNEGPARPRGR